MKLLIITGSNREKKVSYSFAMKIFLRIRHVDRNIKVNILELSRKNLRGCCGNSLCMKNDMKCVYGNDDDFNFILHEMEESDCILFIVPKYAPYPSKFLQFYERLVSIGWGGYINQNRMEQFSLYQKPVGLICFTHSERTPACTFDPLMDSFKSMGFSLISFDRQEHGMVLNLEQDDEAEMLQKIVEAVSERLFKVPSK